MVESVRKGVLDYVPPDIIDTNWCLLRHPEPDTIEFQDLKNSVKEKGILETLLVRRIKPADGEVTLSLIDGLNRLTAAREIGLSVVPCNILDNVDDDEALSLQVQANLFQIQTRKADFAKAIKLLTERNQDTMTIAALAKITNCRVSYLRDLLKITNLPEDIQQLINEGIITMRNALLLTQLPRDELFDWIETAQKHPKDFKILATERIKERRSAKLKAKDDSPWEPTSILIPKKLIEAEIREPKIVKQLISKDTTPEEAFKIALLYTISLDPISVKARIAKREKILKEDEEKRKQGVKKRAEERIKVLQLEMEALKKKMETEE